MQQFFIWLESLLSERKIPFEKQNPTFITTEYFAFKFCKVGGGIEQTTDFFPVWEDFWEKKTDILKSKILGKLGLLRRVPARLCIIKRIDKPTADLFLKENHLQESTNSKIKYGLYLPQKYYRVLKGVYPLEKEFLLCVMTFSGARNFKDGSRSYELLRFCTLKNYTVQGGLTKMLQTFVRAYSPDSIMTYADLDWYSKGTYERFGFEEEGKLPRIYYRLNSEKKRIQVCKDEKWDVFNKGSLKLLWRKR